MKRLAKFWWALFPIGAIVLVILFVRGDIETLKHIAERFIIHFVCGAAVLQWSQLGVAYLERVVRDSLRKAWYMPFARSVLPLRGWAFFFVPAFICVTVIFFREIIDVYNGNPFIKSYADWISWVLGTGSGGYASYRLTPRLVTAIKEIEYGYDKSGSKM